VNLEDIYQASPIWLQEIFLDLHATRISSHRYGQPWRRRVESLARSERMSPDRLRALQDERLREVVSAAYAQSPYYREIFRAAGLEAGDIHGVDDLTRIPLLDKTTVRERGDELVTNKRPSRGWLHGHTSGTTGTPLGLWYDRETCWQTNAVDRRQKTWAGMDAGDWLGVFLGRVTVPTQQHKPPFWRTNHVHRQVWFSSFHMNDENLVYYVREIRRRGIRFLEGYPSTLFILADHVRRHGETLPMASVLTSSETLHEVQRETIEAAFQCRIFDFYGLAERIAFAGECECHDGLHLSEEYAFVEIVDDQGDRVPDGTAGYLVGTSLHNQAMPMIRYRTSDITAIRPSPCACGRTLRRIDRIRTKAEDVVVTPDGRMISPSVLTHPFKPLRGIEKSQIVQTAPDRVLVRIVPGESDLSPEERSRLESALAERLGPMVDLEIETVREIPSDPSGKFRWVVSTVPSPVGLDWNRLDRV